MNFQVVIDHFPLLQNSNYNIWFLNLIFKYFEFGEHFKES